MVTTSFERNLIKTGAGNDVIQDNTTLGNSDFRTGSGNDAINSTAAFVYSEAGNDVVTISQGYVDGGDGTDTLNISQLTGTAGYENRVYFGGGANYATASASLDTIASYIKSANNAFRYFDYLNGKTLDFNAIEKLNVQNGSNANDLVILRH